MTEYRLVEDAMRKAGRVCSLMFAWLVLLSQPAWSQTWMELYPTGVQPAPRYVDSRAYDAANDRLMLFSSVGYNELGGLHPDVWVLADATAAHGTPSWIELSPVSSGPVGRELTPVLYAADSNRLLIYGGLYCGLYGCGPPLSDTWVLAGANGLAGAPEWIRLPDGPGVRVGHSAAWDPNSKRMIVFGGNANCVDRNDVWVLSGADGGSAAAWQELAPTGPLPGPRNYSAVAYDAVTNRLIVTGGVYPVCYGQATYYDDVWVLSNANGLGGTPEWTKLSPLDEPPPGRYGHTAQYDPTTNQLIVFGGLRPGPLSLSETYLNDVWLLSGANGLGSVPRWRKVTPGGTPPRARFWHSAVYSVASNRMVVAMGRNDALTSPSGSSVMNDVWVLLDANGVARVDIIQDGFLRSGNNNTNEGGNPNLVIRSDGHNRVVLTFDLAGLSGPVGRADLRLYVVHNADNWGNTGRTIDVHRVTEPWTEGNGANLQPGNLTAAEFQPYENRGDGVGVTWQCATDTEIHNQASDCALEWSGGSYATSPTATVRIYKDFAGSSTLPPTTATAGWISFNVTSDVNGCLEDGESQCGWLLKKTAEGQPGRIEFASKEGAALLYDALAGEPVAPQLSVLR